MSFNDGLAIAGFGGTVLLLVLDKAGKVKGPMLLLFLGIAVALFLPLTLRNSWVTDAPSGMMRFSRITLLVSILGVIYSLLAIWVSSGGAKTPANEAEAALTPAPATKAAVNQAPPATETVRETPPKPQHPKITVEQHSSGPDSPNVATFGNNSPVTITGKSNPLVPIVWYDYNGVKHIQQGASSEAILGEEYTAFTRFGQLQTEEKWQELIDLCEQQITKSPEWLTPYIFAGIGYANLGQKSKAITRLEYARKHAAGNKDYEDEASRILGLLRETKLK